MQYDCGHCCGFEQKLACLFLDVDKMELKLRVVVEFVRIENKYIALSLFNGLGFQY